MNAERLLEHYEKIAEAPDAIPKLRRFILDLAVRGKLTKRDSYKYDVKRLGEIATLQNGYAFKSEWFAKTGIRLLRNVNVGHGRIEWQNLVCLEQSKAIEFSRFELNCGDIVLSLDRPFITTGTKVARVVENDLPALLLQRVGRFVLSSSLDADFLYLWITSPHFSSQIDAGRSNGVPHISSKQVENAIIPLPSLAEQQRIVAKVDELMGICDRLEVARKDREAIRDGFTTSTLGRLSVADESTFRSDASFAIEHLRELTTRPDQIKQLRQTILNLAVRGKLVPQDPNDEPAINKGKTTSLIEGARLQFELPGNWRWVCVDEVAKARLGKMLDKAKNKGVSYPYLRNTNVHWFEIRLDDLKTIPLDDKEVDEYRLMEGDVLICEGGHGIGRTAVWRGGPEIIVFQKALHRVRPLQMLNPDFFAYCCFVYFDSGILQNYFTGVGIPHFTGRALGKLVFPLPPLSEQSRIVSCVIDLLQRCEQISDALQSRVAIEGRLITQLVDSEIH